MHDIRISYVPQRMALIARRLATPQTASRVIADAFAEILAHIESGAACGAEECMAMFPPDFASPGEHEVRVAVVIADGGPGFGIELDELPACQVVKLLHHGAYATTAEGWSAIEEWMDEHDLEPARDYWEVYLNSPAEVPECELATELLVPLP